MLLMAKSHGTCFFFFYHKHTHTHMTVQQWTHILSLPQTKTPDITGAQVPLRLLLHSQARCQSPAPPPRSVGSHTGWPLSLSMRHHQSSSRWETSTHTHTDTHLQRMIIHDYGVFQRLKTWPGSMHHSISTVLSLMRLNSSVNRGDRLSRGGETG